MHHLGILPFSYLWPGMDTATLYVRASTPGRATIIGNSRYYKSDGCNCVNADVSLADAQYDRFKNGWQNGLVAGEHNMVSDVNTDHPEPGDQQSVYLLPVLNAI